MGPAGSSRALPINLEPWNLWQTLTGCFPEYRKLHGSERVGFDIVFDQFSAPSLENNVVEAVVVAIVC